MMGALSSRTLEEVAADVKARTLEELAKLSGVSRSTVSRVLNGGSVGESTKRRVLAVVEKSSYQPNLAARRLAQGRTGILGLVFHTDAADLFGDPYWSLLLKGTTDAAATRATGVMLWLKTSSPAELLSSVLGVGLIDGAVVTASYRNDPLVDGLVESDLPIVLVGHGGHSERASYVDIDDLAAATQLVTYLIDLGRRRIATVAGPARSVAGSDRSEGYRRALWRAGLAVDERLVVEGDFNEASGHACTMRLLESGAEFDALFAANDSMARGALRALTQHGLNVPDDVALAGFDDVDFAEQLSLTTVRQPVQRMGELATTTLLELIDSPDGGPRRVILPTELIARRSTEGPTMNAWSPGSEPGDHAELPPGMATRNRPPNGGS